MKGRICCICGRPGQVYGFALSLNLLTEAGFKTFETGDRSYAHDRCIRKAQKATGVATHSQPYPVRAMTADEYRVAWVSGWDAAMERIRVFAAKEQRSDGEPETDTNAANDHYSRGIEEPNV